MRLTPKVPFTLMQKLVAIMVGRRIKYREIAEKLHIAKATVKMHAKYAAAKLPGDLPPTMKLVFWWRHATKDQLAPRSDR